MQHHLFHLNPYNSISTPKVNSHYNCYMLLGYDILISEDLQAHLIGESMIVGHSLLSLDDFILCFRNQQPAFSLCTTRLY